MKISFGTLQTITLDNYFYSCVKIIKNRRPIFMDTQKKTQRPHLQRHSASHYSETRRILEERMILEYEKKRGPTLLRSLVLRLILPCLSPVSIATHGIRFTVLPSGQILRDTYLDYSNPT